MSTRPAERVLVTARPPLVAFNLDLDSDDLELARRHRGAPAGIGRRAARGVRAIGLFLPARGRVQVSFNVHDHQAVPLRVLVEEVEREAPVAEAELVGLAPAAALRGLPRRTCRCADFDPARHLIENALRSVS